jgi:outer membrane protein insertion porin family
VEYGKVTMEGAAGRPLRSWLRFSARAGFGRVFPYGVSVPAPDGSDRLGVYLKLRDATLTAGGGRDVRGWSMELLGPKIPDLRVASGDGESLRAGRYIPLGGLARWTGSLELEVPLPFVGWPHGTHFFLDAGQVWTPDRRFLPSKDSLVPGQRGNRARFGTGIGITLSTPVGPVQLDLGYKLNPSPLDVRRPGEVARALDEGMDLKNVKEAPFMRWHLHFSVGRIQ